MNQSGRVNGEYNTSRDSRGRRDRGERNVNSAHKLMRARMTFLFMLFICGLFFVHTTAHAKNQKNKYYASICIEEADSLWSIATEYMTEEYGSVEDYIREVKRINHIGSDRIQAGCYLTIPYYAEQPIAE